MIPTLGEFRLYRTCLSAAIARIAEVPTGARGRELNKLRAALGRVDKYLRKARAKVAGNDPDRKPLLLAEYQGETVSFNMQAPADLLEAIDLETEELGTTRSAQIRELMALWVRERVAHKRKLATSQAAQLRGEEAANAR